MDRDLEDSLRYCEGSLRPVGIDPSPLKALAEALLAVDEGHLKDVLVAFGNLANQYDSTTDSDYGALLLEEQADRSQDLARKRKLYESAESRSAFFASGATSGGEGTARMIDVNRVRRKLGPLR